MINTWYKVGKILQEDKSVGSIQFQKVMSILLEKEKKN